MPKDAEKKAMTYINSLDDSTSHYYAWQYWDFIAGRREEKPDADDVGPNRALTIRATLINIGG